jgi:hypothetical protein
MITIKISINYILTFSIHQLNYCWFLKALSGFYIHLLSTPHFILPTTPPLEITYLFPPILLSKNHLHVHSYVLKTINILDIKIQLILWYWVLFDIFNDRTYKSWCLPLSHEAFIYSMALSCLWHKWLKS